MKKYFFAYCVIATLLGASLVLSGCKGQDEATPTSVSKGGETIIQRPMAGKYAGKAHQPGGKTAGTTGSNDGP